MYKYINPLSTQKDESYFAFILTELDHLLVRVVGATTEEFIPSLSFRVFNDEQFLSDIPRLFKDNFKAVILEIFTHQPVGYGEHSLWFCMNLRAAFEVAKIPCYFINGTNKTLATLLIATNISPKINETFLMVLIDDDNKVAACELKYTEKGYIKSSHRIIPIDEKEAPQETRAKIVGECNPKKIIVSSIPGNTVLKHLRTAVLKSKKLIVLEATFTQYHDKFLVETAKWLLDKSYVKYFILPFNVRRSYIFSLSGTKNNIILSAEIEDQLPLKKSVIIPKSHLDYYMVLIDVPTNETQLLYEVNQMQNFHRHEITLKVDDQSFPEKRIKGIILDEIKNLPRNLDKHLSSEKIPVIGIFDDSAVVCISKDNKYEFLGTWNGAYGTQLIINFCQEKHAIGDKAIAILDEPSFIVYDLIKIMSMPSEKVEIDPTWTFTIIKDAENPVLLEFDNAENVDGEKSAASPAFLMALILKEIRKLIKVEVGKKPKELAFWIFNDGNKYNEEEIKRIELQLTESCHLIKTSCNFVKF